MSIQNLKKVMSPLDQFKHYILNTKQFEYIDISSNIFKNNGILSFTVDNLVIFGVLILIILYIIGMFSVNYRKVIVSLIGSGSEAFYILLYKTLIQQSTKEMSFFFPLFTLIFLMILSFNIAGLLNWSFTITSHIVITFYLALTLNLAILIYGIKRKKVKFYKMFVTSGLNIYMTLFVSILEIFSYLLRPLSLAIRLFANMVAGHILLLIVSSLSFIVAKYTVYNELVILYIDITLLIITSIVVLEIAIAFIQAYVFCILICIYLNDHLTTTNH